MQQEKARGRGWHEGSGHAATPPRGQPLRRARTAAGLLAGLTALLLVMAFQAVVRGGMVQGDARRVASARQSDAAAACGRLPGRERRSRCRAGLGP